MDDVEVGRYWNGNADVWTRLSRAGYDVYRDYLNTPAFLAMLPEVDGLYGVDVGCGEGHNTRLVAGRGGRMVGIDIAERFIEHARAAEDEQPLGIEYRVASALQIPFGAEHFDFAVAFMSLMDIPTPEAAIAEVFRVLKDGGFFQCSITHPVTNTWHRRNLRGADGRTYALELGGYFSIEETRIDEWFFGATPPELRTQLKPFRVPRFHRTVSGWLNAFVRAGFVLEYMSEPRASDEVVEACPDLQDTQVMPYFLHIRCRKPRLGGD